MKTLKNQIKADRIGHAYLILRNQRYWKDHHRQNHGQSGQLRASSRRQVPAMNVRPVQAIAAGTSMNVIEIDAASNNGVDNIREIRDEVAYSSHEGKYKVYIIDEVHMLSIGAFNALLKTLEEPPSYVIFILATTEAAQDSRSPFFPDASAMISSGFPWRPLNGAVAGADG